MTEPSNVAAIPSPLVVSIRTGLEEMLSREWLLANDLGSYASSTAIGCNTRRYHGLLTAATTPPVGRITALNSVMEQLLIGNDTHDLATNEFPGAISPQGYRYLVEFRNDAAPTFVYRIGHVELTKEILLAENANAVCLRYTLRGEGARLRLWPFVAMRGYHHLRKVHEPHQMSYQTSSGGVIVLDSMRPIDGLHLTTDQAEFTPKPQWWYNFQYRSDLARGQDGHEDLFTPGFFTYSLAAGQSCQFTASLGTPVHMDFGAALTRRKERLGDLAKSVEAYHDVPMKRLAMAADSFVVQRSFPGEVSLPTIVAGYHWFADWGRDTFIALPGLLLATGRYEQARGVFRTFAKYISEGQVPNVFDDYAATAHYNSIDASLWFIIAAERYLEATGDTAFWQKELMPACHTILESYAKGTRFDIHADADGLLLGGSPTTQLTWMDAKLGDEVVTPRHGKAVEVNAMWHSAHAMMAQRCRGIDDALAAAYAQKAKAIGAAFAKAFWCEQYQWLYDCLTPEGPDASLRPNQIFAVALPHCPLSAKQQAAVVNIVASKLLTPRGLRTLSPDDPRYRRRYGCSWEDRDRAYHQGTVWAYLIGPFIEAFLKVENCKPFALARAKTYLAGFDADLEQAGLGFISEIYDGDLPHTPCGCIAQAWSVAEVLRAKKLLADLEKRC